MSLPAAVAAAESADADAHPNIANDADDDTTSEISRSSQRFDATPARRRSFHKLQPAQQPADDRYGVAASQHH